MENVESHKVAPPPESQACEGAVGAGILLSKEASSRGTVGAETYADRTCTPPTVYSSADAVVAAEKDLLAGNKEPLKAFALPAASAKDQDRQVQDSISGLEEQLGYKLNYLWFNDENGKAEVFLLGKADKPGDVATAPAPAACVPFDKLVDTSLDLQNNLPLDTTVGDAAKIIQERNREAELVKVGIPANASEAEVKAIQADRAAQLKSLQDQQRPEDDRTMEEVNAFNLAGRAIASGLRPGSTDDEIKQTEEADSLAASAIKLGLAPGTTADQIADVQKRIDNTPDVALDQQMGLPLDTSRGDALELGLKWTKDSNLIAKGYSPDMTPDQIKQESEARQQAALPYQAILRDSNATPDETNSAQLAISAIQIGLPADSSAQKVEETTALYSRQSSAVLVGLNKDASEEAIKAAQDRSDGDLANATCVDNP